MNNTKLTNGLLLVLLVFNIAFIGSWWYGHWRSHKMQHQGYTHNMGEHDGKGGMFMMKELNFTQDQQTKLDTLRKAHFHKIEMLDNAVARNEKNMMNAIMGNSPDSGRASICADSIGMLKATIQKELFRHFEGIKKICNPDQSRKFDSLMVQMSGQFSHHHDFHHGANEMHHDSM